MTMNTWYERLTKWRRHLHRYPELSFQEVQTTAYIIEQLAGLPGVKVEYGVDVLGIDTGVLATIGTGQKPVVGLRADIDALPITEETNAEYQSLHSSVMHACGHDGHTAMLIGAIHQLSEMYEAGQLHGTVKCLFQPAEETEDSYGKTGAQYVLQSNALDDVESLVALHLDPEIPLGEVKLKAGTVMANVDTFSITISGTGGHGAYPEQTIDPIWLSSIVLPALYSLPARKISPLEPAVLSVCEIKGGASTNVIPSAVTIRGTMRTYSQETRESLSNELALVLNTVKGLGGSYELKLHHGEPALYNDPVIVSLFEEAIRTVEPNVIIHSDSYGMGGEDFSHITKKIPGAMMFLGAKDMTRPNTSLHQPRFTIDEKALVLGMEALICATEKMLLKGGNVNDT